MMTLSPKQYLRKIRKQTEAISICDEMLNVIECSSSFEKMFGVSKGDMISNGMNPISLCTQVQPSGKSSAVEFRSLIKAAFESDVSQEKAEFEMKNMVDGTTFSAAVWLSVVRFTGHKNLLQVIYRKGINSGIDINEFLKIDDEISEFGEMSEFQASVGSYPQPQQQAMGFEAGMDRGMSMDPMYAVGHADPVKDYMTLMSEIFLTQVTVIKNHIHAASFPVTKRRVGLFRNGFKTGGVMVMLPASLDELFEICRARLRLAKARRIYTIQGIEIFDIETIMPEDHLYISSGEKFMPPTQSGELNALIFYHEKANEPYSTYERDANKELVSDDSDLLLDDLRAALNKQEGMWDFFEESVDGPKKLEKQAKVTWGTNLLVLSAAASRPGQVPSGQRLRQLRGRKDSADLSLGLQRKAAEALQVNVAPVKGSASETVIHAILHSAEAILGREQKGERVPVSEVEKAMMKTLEDDIASQFFEDYLEKNFTLHLLLFYIDCAKFEAIPTMEDAQMILKKYVDDTDNPITSTVGFEEIKKAQKKVYNKEFDQTMFVQSAKQVFSALSNSGFSSFLHSYHFKALLSSFKDRGADEIVTGNNALHRAVKTGNVTVIKDLTRKGFPINIKNRHGDTPLHMSVKLMRVKVVRALLDAGADVNIQDNALNTPTHLAATAGNKGVLKALLEYKPDMELTNSMQISVMQALSKR